jgi:hypothetical protein
MPVPRIAIFTKSPYGPLLFRQEGTFLCLTHHNETECGSWERSTPGRARAFFKVVTPNLKSGLRPASFGFK